ncbi:MAG: efflux RND transporter periplasmic adaptor subunit [Bacteroidales bacterium]|nr:efflux RND transporter periplasmic adaptor subunit [Bacteroidales bacterium]
MKRIAIAALAALTLVSCGGNNKVTEKKEQQSEALPSVKVQKVFAREVPQITEYTSTVQANVINNIAPQSALRIREINVEIGDYVKSGDVLARMDVASLEQAKLQLVNDSTELVRIRSLFEVGAVSQSDLDNMTLSYNVRKTTYENLRENTILCSPVDGVVTARNYDKGDLYTMRHHHFTAQHNTPAKLIVANRENDYTRIRKGGRCRIVVDALPGESFTGFINLIYPIMDQATHTFTVEVQVPNKDRRLRPGMYAKVYVDYGSNHSVVVPDVAVSRLQGSGDRFVYVLGEDGTVSYRKVELGVRMGAEYEILSGVKDSEEVVVEGLLRIRDGVKVKVER